jgi:THO complex subunit 1
MAPKEVAQDAVAVRLDHLLQRARIVKPSTAIDPPLQVSELVPDNQLLLGSIDGEKDARLLAVDSSARHLFYAILVCQTSSPQDLADVSREQPESTSPHS